MNHYRQFIFKGYDFDAAAHRLTLRYGYDNDLEFRETYQFDFDFVEYDPAALDRALQLLFFMAGVSYYKMYLAPQIIVQAGEIDEALAAFLGRTYQRGLGEFFYRNGLDPRTPVTFPVNSPPLGPITFDNTGGQLVGLGGGKDSLVSVELLQGRPRLATWSLNHRPQLTPLVERVGLPHLWVGREWDPQIQALNTQGALNGHIPISAIFACVGTAVNILSGYRDHIVSNESSASEPTLHHAGVAINHQYSKSLAYEQDFQACLQALFGDSIRYYSLLRPFSELHIAEMFATVGFAKYREVFSSCNRAFTLRQNHLSWCGQCPKCAFVFLVLTPFVARPQLEQLWGGKNLLLDPALVSTYRQLLGIEGDKPFDCVGEIKEARAAMRLAQTRYSELQKYAFDLPTDYDFRAWGPHCLPPNIFSQLQARV